MKVARTVVPVIAFGLACTVFTLWCSRSDRQITKSLLSRVTRAQAVPARVVLGPVAVGALGVAVALEVVITWLIALRASGGDAVAFGGGVAAVWVITLFALRVVLHRPTVAQDASSLAVDERLRALDALYAMWPVGWAAVALIGPLDLRGVQEAQVVVLLAAAAMMVSAVLPFSHPAERVRYGSGRSRSHP